MHERLTLSLLAATYWYTSKLDPSPKGQLCSEGSGETVHMCIRLASAFAERPEISTKLEVGFLHTDAKELFERASASAQT